MYPLYMWTPLYIEFFVVKVTDAHTQGEILTGWLNHRTVFLPSELIGFDAEYSWLTYQVFVIHQSNFITWGEMLDIIYDGQS